MSPDRKQRAAAKKAVTPKGAPAPIKLAASSDDAHSVVYFKRHKDDDPSQAAPGRQFLRSCPTKVRATMDSVLAAVAAAPPKRFSGGGYWEAMHDDMTGWFEIRVDGPKRQHYRLFCRLDYEAAEVERPLLVIIDGRSKPFRTTLSDAEYAEVRSYGDEYFKRNPRSIM